MIHYLTIYLLCSKKLNMVNIVIDVIINYYIKIIYNKLLQNNIEEVNHFIISLIKFIEDNTTILSDDDINSRVLPLLYTSFIDIFLGKLNRAHDKIRDMHYFIITKYSLYN